VLAEHLHNPGATSGSEVEQDTSLIRLANVFLAARRQIILGGVLAAALTSAIVLLLPRTYTANATFVPQSRRSLNLSGAASGLATSLGLGLPTGEPNESPAFYVELLTSHQVLAAAVDTVYPVVVPASGRTQSVADWLSANGRTPALRRENAIERLRNSLSTTAEPRLGLVRLSVRTKSAALSQELVKFLVREVDRFNSDRRQSQAAMERQFIEHRVQAVQQQVRRAEDDMQEFLVRNRDFRNSPDLVFRQERLSQQVQLYRQLFTSLMQSYEQARIDAVRDTPLITVIESPLAPLRPDRRGLAAKFAAAFVLGASLVALLAFIGATVSRGVSESPDTEMFQRLRADAWEDLRNPLRALRRMSTRFGRSRAADSEHE